MYAKIGWLAYNVRFKKSTPYEKVHLIKSTQKKSTPKKKCTKKKVHLTKSTPNLKEHGKKMAS